MENLLNKPASVLDIIPETVYPTPNISQPIVTTPQTFAQAFSAARRAGLKVFDYKGKKYTTQLKGETETVDKGVTTTAKTKQGNTRGSNKPIDNDTPVVTVNLPEVEVAAKRYVANIGGKEYAFPSQERRDAFVKRVNRVIHNSLVIKNYDPKRYWYRTKIG